MGEALVPDDGLLIAPAMHFQRRMRLGPADLAVPEPEGRVGFRVFGPGGGVRRIPFREAVGRGGLAGIFAKAVGAVGDNNRRREPSVIGRKRVSLIDGRSIKSQAPVIRPKNSNLTVAHDEPFGSVLPFFDCALQ
jgi:hypothetical protein